MAPRDAEVGCEPKHEDGSRLVADTLLQSGERWLAVAPPDGDTVLALVAPKVDSKLYQLIGRPTDVVFVTNDVLARFREWSRRAADASGIDSVLSHGKTIVGKALVVKGEISGNEALVVEGEVDGSITLLGQRVTVRPQGRIRGSIEARHVILHGQVEGDILAASGSNCSEPRL